MSLLDLISITLAALALYQLQDLKRQTNARLTTLERQQKQARPEYIGGSKMPLPPEKTESLITTKEGSKSIFEYSKPIEGFNPKKVNPVLPRSEEERNARVKTEWEINSDFKIIG